MSYCPDHLGFVYTCNSCNDAFKYEEQTAGWEYEMDDDE